MDQIIQITETEGNTAGLSPVLIKVHCEEQPPGLISDKPIINHSFLLHREQCHIPSGCTNQSSEGTKPIWNQIYSSSGALRFAGRPQFLTCWKVLCHVRLALRNRCVWFSHSDFSWSLAWRMRETSATSSSSFKEDWGNQEDPGEREELVGSQAALTQELMGWTEKGGGGKWPGRGMKEGHWGSLKRGRRNKDCWKDAGSKQTTEAWERWNEEGTACRGRDWWPLVGLKCGPGPWVWQGEACWGEAGQDCHDLAVLLLCAQLALIVFPPTFVHPLTCLTPCLNSPTVLPLQWSQWSWKGWFEGRAREE